jgi:hypothetical protein
MHCRTDPSVGLPGVSGPMPTSKLTKRLYFADDPEGRLAWSDPEWYVSAGAHYSELSAWLREVAGRRRLPNPQRKRLTLARRYERLAARLERKGLLTHRG